MPFIFDPSLKGESWKVGSKRKRVPLTEERLKQELRSRPISGVEVRVGEKAAIRLQETLQGMNGTMTPQERREALAKRRDRLAAEKGDQGAKARLADPRPF